MAASQAQPDPAALVTALLQPACHGHGVSRTELRETHISWVILTGAHVYKFKKPVNLGFLDFTTLESRRHFCEEELRLNRRLAPTLYEAVVKISGDAAHPVIDGDGPAIEYALKMREFPQQALASTMLAADTLEATHIDALATLIAEFHAQTGVAARGSPYGTPEAVIEPARDNMVQLQRLLPEATDQTRITELSAWTEQAYRERWPVFGARHAQGFVRECHGDLHLGNIVMLSGILTPFDCIEFAPALRWIDVMNEVAFVVMDLTDRGRADWATRFLNAYLETSGDYPGLEVLRFYMVYRALVRAKVHALRAQQAGMDNAARERLIAAARDYVALAQRCAIDQRPSIILMHGLSGSGKSVIAQALADDTGAVRLRSDVERKRLSGLTALARSDSALAAGLYSQDLTQATYHRLLDCARTATKAGYAAVIDATFLKRWQRDLFRREAAAQGIPLLIVDLTAPEATLHARITSRLAAGTDASEAGPAVLADQLAQDEAFDADELPFVLSIDSAQSDVQTVQRTACKALRERLASQIKE